MQEDIARRAIKWALNTTVSLDRIWQHFSIDGADRVKFIEVATRARAKRDEKWEEKRQLSQDVTDKTVPTSPTSSLKKDIGSLESPDAEASAALTTFSTYKTTPILSFWTPLSRNGIIFLKVLSYMETDHPPAIKGSL